ncbi:hypothetical protein PDE_04852 [Penicillium oxalicum 114-2]|uniref:Uncharacterized protein n=1 Tax=Penicillium oxalicum (strain 114-2 / CGMCC 5302) TaxID=933388 RepID=S8B5P7_PENO1|nr:hypothetical protein PDE_04852 [Penicillium oxalicum 114-2]
MTPPNDPQRHHPPTWFLQLPLTLASPGKRTLLPTQALNPELATTVILHGQYLDQSPLPQESGLIDLVIGRSERPVPIAATVTLFLPRPQQMLTAGITAFSVHDGAINQSRAILEARLQIQRLSPLRPVIFAIILDTKTRFDEISSLHTPPPPKRTI